jgi:ATP-dependent DNA helicase RecG
LQELKGAALDRFLLQRQGRTWDSVPMPGVKIDDLSWSDIKKFREMATASGRLTEADLSANDPDLLAKLKLTEGSYLKRSAVLLFHHDPDRLFTGAYVKIGFFTSESELAYHDEIHGSLFYQAHTVFDLIRTKYMKAAISYKGIQRIELFPVPNEALREVILNALVHRDYAVPAPIQIRVYEDKMKIWNPAVLPDNWTVETLLGAHASQPYNPDVANAFFRSGEIESWGRGIERIVSACRNADSPPPDIKLQGHDLWFEFPYSDNYLELMRNGADKKRSSQTKNMRDSQDGLVDRLVDGLVENQQNILKVIKTNPRVSKKQMAEIIGISTTAIDKNIEKLKKLGLLKRVGSPKSGYWEVTQ